MQPALPARYYYYVADHAVLLLFTLDMSLIVQKDAERTVVAFENPMYDDPTVLAPCLLSC
jgi:hypothetical protein